MLHDKKFLKIRFEQVFLKQRRTDPFDISGSLKNEALIERNGSEYSMPLMQLFDHTASVVLPSEWQAAGLPTLSVSRQF